jgi:drug/metabolite transporter (DMT)-like permease
VDDKIIGIAAALGSAASWALGSVLFKKLGDELPPIALTFAKGVVGSLLLALALIPIGFAGVEAWPLMLLILSGLLGIAVGDTFFFLALRNLGAHAIVVLLTLGQVFTLLLAVVWLGERPSLAEWTGIAAVVAGVTIVLWIRLSDEHSKSNLTGVAWGLAAVACMAVSIIIAKEALAVVNSLQAAFIRMVAGTAGIFLFGAATRQLIGSMTPLRTPRFAGFFVVSVFVVTFGGFWLSLLSIEKIDVTIANTLNSTEPLFVLPLAAFVLKETITLGVILGSVLTVIGIVLLIAPW